MTTFTVTIEGEPLLIREILTVIEAYHSQKPSPAPAEVKKKKTMKKKSRKKRVFKPRNCVQCEGRFIPSSPRGRVCAACLSSPPNSEEHSAPKLKAKAKREKNKENKKSNPPPPYSLSMATDVSKYHTMIESGTLSTRPTKEIENVS